MDREWDYKEGGSSSYSHFYGEAKIIKLLEKMKTFLVFVNVLLNMTALPDFHQREVVYKRY